MTPAGVHDWILDGKCVLVHLLKIMKWYNFLKDKLTICIRCGNHAPPV